MNMRCVQTNSSGFYLLHRSFRECQVITGDTGPLQASALLSPLLELLEIVILLLISQKFLFA